MADDDRPEAIQRREFRFFGHGGHLKIRLVGQRLHLRHILHRSLAEKQHRAALCGVAELNHAECILVVIGCIREPGAAVIAAAAAVGALERKLNRIPRFRRRVEVQRLERDFDGRRPTVRAGLHVRFPLRIPVFDVVGRSAQRYRIEMGPQRVHCEMAVNAPGIVRHADEQFHAVVRPYRGVMIFVVGDELSHCRVVAYGFDVQRVIVPVQGNVGREGGAARLACFQRRKRRSIVENAGLGGARSRDF